MTGLRLQRGLPVVVCLLLCAAPAFAADGPPKLDAGDTAWMLTSTALAPMTTIPGLALFYAGMVRKKNVLATMMQSFAICRIVTLAWAVAGYSIAFTTGNAHMDLVRDRCQPGWRPRRDGQFILQCQGVGKTIVYSSVMTLIVLMVVRTIRVPRVNDDQEREGLDIVLHGEQVF